MNATEKMLAKLLEKGLVNEWKKGDMHRYYLDFSKVHDALDAMDDAAKRHARLPLNRREMNNGKIWIEAETLEIKTKNIELMLNGAQSIMETLEDLTAEPEEEEAEEESAEETEEEAKEEPEMKKLWYAVMIDNEDADWGCGSFDRARAESKVSYLRAHGSTEAYIAVIDANYDDNGCPTTDGECVAEIRDF